MFRWGGVGWNFGNLACDTEWRQMDCAYINNCIHIDFGLQQGDDSKEIRSFLCFSSSVSGKMPFKMNIWKSYEWNFWGENQKAEFCGLEKKFCSANRLVFLLSGDCSGSDFVWNRPTCARKSFAYPRFPQPNSFNRLLVRESIAMEQWNLRSNEFD